VIVLSYCMMEWEEAKKFKPVVVFPDPKTNKI
jgi:aspartate 1-decarboxylase